MDFNNYREQEIYKTAEKYHKTSLVRISSIIPDTLQQIVETEKEETSIVGISTGFKSLDRISGGFRKGQFIVLASRPAMGKTSLALNMALNSALYHDKKIAIFTIDMKIDELLMKMLSSASEVSLKDMENGIRLTDKKKERITKVAEILSEKEIYFDDNRVATVSEIREKIHQLKAEIGGLDMVIIDYLQLMNSNRRYKTRQEEISEISRNLKALAKESELPIIVLSQLNRSLESRTDKRPILSDLSGSGAIEQDADIVMFVYREVVYNEKTETPHRAEILVKKNKLGPIGTVCLFFKPEFTSFSSIREY
ncbi:MAG: replicative DNA helicase [Candidatus Cloacimonetes bacterium]|nr:replicative DNA helicase [Candidatus Cloacimonadota bacterium]